MFLLENTMSRWKTHSGNNSENVQQNCLRTILGDNATEKLFCQVEKVLSSGADSEIQRPPQNGCVVPQDD